jgi:hypothetical protein
MKTKSERLQSPAPSSSRQRCVPWWTMCSQCYQGLATCELGKDTAGELLTVI